MVSEEYDDGRVACADDGLRLRWYYFPWGTKHIPYDGIRGVRRVDIDAFTGRARIWGTANPRYWANLDPARAKKKVGLVVDTGRRVTPFITPDDPDRVEALLRERGPPRPGDRGLRPGADHLRAGSIAWDAVPAAAAGTIRSGRACRCGGGRNRVQTARTIPR